MCGIAGFIGKSKKPKVTAELATQLFDFLELRGRDAAGVWGAEGGKKENNIIYHKEPGRSSEFIKRSFWKKIQNTKPNILLLHARATSPGVGHANVNKNNHPFVSADFRIGMIHNGRVNEADFLKDKYKIKSETDSEVLLRMYEHGVDLKDNIDIEVNEEGDFDLDPEIISRIKGLKEIWSWVHRGAMAVAYGEYVDLDTRYLWLFRNEHRPLWIGDAREALGQIFFFSSPDIWYRAISSSASLRNACESMNSLIEIPVGQIWFFKVDKENPYIGYDENSYSIFDIDIGDKKETWEKENVKVCDIKEPQMSLNVTSDLDDDECIIYSKNKIDNNSITIPETDALTKKIQEANKKKNKRNDPDDYGPCNYNTFNGTEHEELITEIDAMIADFNTDLTNSFLEGSIADSDYEEVLEALDSIKEEIEGACDIIRPF